jgi:hypothetical protein
MVFSSDRLPHVDLTLGNSKGQHGILLTDDELYHASLTVKDPQVYTPSLIQQRNWAHLRIFSRQWWADREGMENELAKFMHKAVQQDDN